MTFSSILEHDGLHFQLQTSIENWSLTCGSELLPLAAQITSDCETLGISNKSESFVLPNAIVATWIDSVATLAKLPPTIPFPLDLRLSSGLGKPGASITTRWMKVGTSIALSIAPDIKGLLVDFKGQLFRLTEPYWTVLQLVDQFNTHSNDTNKQFEYWAAIRTQLGEDKANLVSDGFLRSLRVISANAFTLGFSKDASGALDIVPRLMRKNYDPSGQDMPEGSGNLTGELALIPDDESLFVSRLDDLQEGQTVFPLRDGTFVAVTPELAKQLSAIRKVRRSSNEEKRQMVLNPSGLLREILAGTEGDETTLDFIETDKYSDRVTNLAAWVPPIIPWVKIPPIDWKGSCETEVGFRIGDKEITLDRDLVEQAIESVQEAISSGHENASIANGTLVPATDFTLKSLKHLQKALSESKSESSTDSPENTKEENLVLVIETNFDQEDFCRVRVPPRPGNPGMPYSLKTIPKVHQETGIRWLQEHWLIGSKGCLLADDMGLGKTYQALAFLTWLKEQMNDGLLPQKPLLVVAPVGLLANWEKEETLHLKSGSLGEPLRAYGSWLRFLKRGTHAGGTAALDTLELSRATWVLANYEAISDYQLSFGAIQFGTVIFDEAQKIKSPSTGMTSAAKALNSDFVVTMTGTPVENRLADLWCIVDTCQPGALKDLKSFSQKFEANPDSNSLQILRSQLWQKEEKVAKSAPLIMLRRLKSEKLKGLPEKHEHQISKTMPLRQLESYRQATALNNIRGPKGMLGLIQSLRQISLHPGLFDGQGFDPSDSARFSAMVDILDKVHALGEKALIFIDSLEIQSTSQLPLLLQKRYGLSNLPLVINGAVGTSERQKRVDAFQSSNHGFDVMLLSPKAGGVGLTLTAANHVIHLSRWWNPAVEDQCSDRAYRIGQTRDVHVYYPLAINPNDPEHSFDLKLNELMTRKRELSRSMLMPMDFGKEDYDELVSGLGI